MPDKLKLTYENSTKGIRSTNALESLNFARHKWYFVKEGFSPNLVKQAILDTKCDKNDLIFDAFSGGGTVPVTAAVEGFKAIGIEVNPFLAFVSRTKLIQCKPQTIERYLPDIINAFNNGIRSPLEDYSTFSKSKGKDKWLFNKVILQCFESAWRSTIGISPNVRDLIRLSLIGAAMDVCNAVKDGKCLRYPSGWEKKRYGKRAFLNAFNKRINEIKKDLYTTPIRNSNAKIILADSRSLNIKEIKGEKFKLCIMSPPYLNSFDYTDIYRPELFLGKFVKSNLELQKLRLRTLRSHVQVGWEEPRNESLGQIFKNTVNEINKHKDGLWNNRIPSMIKAYFEDIKKVLINLKRISCEDASIWIVVSTSAYAGIEIPVDLIIADIGSQVGWFLRELKVIHYLRRVPGQQWESLSEKKNGRPHLRESIIILDTIPKAQAKSI